MYITLNSSDFEQGSIGSSGNINSTTKIRTKEYIQFLGNKSSVTVTVKTVSGQNVLLDFLGYADGTAPTCDIYWKNNPFAFDVSGYTVLTFRLVIKYSTEADITPDDIESVTIDSPFTWTYKDGRPVPIANQNLPTDHSFPDARWVWRYSPEGIPYNGFMMMPEPTEPKGAFRNAEKLERVYIPESVKYIGAEAFVGTALKTVKIAADCEYSPTSFPEGCIVEFYGGGGDYGQLYDCDGCAVLDSEAARIYVKESDKNG